jgi:hypothetical protein
MIELSSWICQKGRPVAKISVGVASVPAGCLSAGSDQEDRSLGLLRYGDLGKRANALSKVLTNNQEVWIVAVLASEMTTKLPSAALDPGVPGNVSDSNVKVTEVPKKLPDPTGPGNKGVSFCAPGDSALDDAADCANGTGVAIFPGCSTLVTRAQDASRRLQSARRTITRRQRCQSTRNRTASTSL